MAKQALGRNLEALLENKARAPLEEPAPVSSGVRSLMRGHQASPAAVLPASAIPPLARKKVWPPWYLFGGDILLTGLALIIVCKSPHPLSWRHELFCGAAVFLGAGLAVAAVAKPDEE